MTTLVPTAAKPAWHAALHGLDLQLGKVRFDLQMDWGRFAAPGAKRGDVLADQLGRPGLWKLRSGERGKARGVFDLPPAVLPREDADAERFRALARWAQSTSRGKPDKSWTPPPSEEIERLLPEMALTLQVGAIALQGTMTHDGSRLAFGFPIVSRIPGELPAARMAWLRELLTDGQDRWRLVRIGLTGVGEARAEVDLSGAPHDAIESLVAIGVDALRLVVSSLAEPAEFLVHGAEGCRALEFPPTNKRRPV